ncbi:MAG: CRTAC1 family protein [Candidatus Omnitrophota bacterium]|jgi:hypothetical protein|nr:MAG: CRTAC1 family protein [Candidatus Omnitrophota bacterium]
MNTKQSHIQNALWIFLFFSPCSHAQFHFVENAREKGILFHQVNGSAEKYYIVEAKGGGVAVADVDGDGWDDIYFVNGSYPENREERVLPRNQLFLNNQDGTFRNATDESGLGDEGFGIGAYFADVNNDGRPDCYVTNYGPNQLYINQGNLRFQKVENAGGAQDEGFSTGVAFADINHDGFLDLYLGQYAVFSKDIADRLGATTNYYGKKTFLGPAMFKPANDHLFINNGDGTFREETKLRGINSFQTGRAFTVAFSDLDNDGDLDIYVANDMSCNILYENKGNGFFEDISLFAGVGLSEDGAEQSGMGLAIGDVDGDLNPDIAVANYQDEYNVLYRNEGNMRFFDASVISGIEKGSRPLVCFGLLMEDFDNDSRTDLYYSAGHVYPIADEIPSLFGYEMRNPIYHNTGRGIFVDKTAQSGPGCGLKGVSRGSAAADFDHDGDVDIIVNNLDGSPFLLENRSAIGNWLQLAVQDERGAPAYGARVVVETEATRQMKELYSSASFLSQSSATLHFGLGDAKQVKRIGIRWPDGNYIEMESLAVNQKLEIKR